MESSYYQMNYESIPVLDDSNPYDKGGNYKPDLADFRMPYMLYGREDLEQMEAVYSKLHNRTEGNIIQYSMNQW